MIRLQLTHFFVIFSCYFAFSQQEEKNAHLSLRIQNELGESFKEKILIIANKDTIPVTASWDNSFRVDLLPGNYRLILKNKLCPDYWITDLFLQANETKELNITWKYQIIRLPEIRHSICNRY